MTSPTERHVHVLLQEALQHLAVRPGSTVVDCTLGLGGHSSEIARRLGPQGKLIAFDRDPQAMELAMSRLDAVLSELGSQAPKVEFIGETFSSAPKHLQPGTVDGLLA